MEKEQAHCSGDLETLSSGDKNVKEERGWISTVSLIEKALITDQVGSRQGRSSRKVKNAFELFPLEIWEMMLDQMDDSKDILTVLRGIPQLDISVKTGYKRFWYIGEILPSLYDLIEQTDVLNLRLVCKDWQRRVDHFLPNQPYFRAYSEKLHKDYPDFWMFMHESTFWKDQNAYYYNSGLFDYGGPLISVDGVFKEESSVIMDQALEHPRNRNPFVFRALELDIYYLWGDDDEGEDPQLQKILSFLDKFGSHLWYLKISLGLLNNNLEITNLLKILQFTPNLKCLTLDVLEEIKENAPYNNAKLLEKSLPELPFLESLEVINYRDTKQQTSFEVSSGLMCRYGAQIRRLDMPMNHWRPEFKEMFPQLTELELHLSCNSVSFCYNCWTLHSYLSPSKSDISTFPDLLLTLSAPNLVTIKLVVYPPQDLAFSFQKDILKWLKRFPKIKYFEIDCEDRSINDFEDKLLLPRGDPIKDCIPSLQTLKIVDGHGLSYDFLRCFPVLRHLEMQCFCRPTVVDFSIPDTSIKLKEQLQTAKLYESNIWEFLPKLRTIALEPDKCRRRRYDSFIFDRDTYEKLKKFGKIPLEPQLHAYRKDIQDFLDNVPEDPSDLEGRSDDNEIVSDESEPDLDLLNIE